MTIDRNRANVDSSIRSLLFEQRWTNFNPVDVQIPTVAVALLDVSLRRSCRLREIHC